jgi:hypothetical protein
MGYSTDSAPVKSKISVPKEVAEIYHRHEDDDGNEIEDLSGESPQGWYIEDDCFKFKKKIWALQLKKGDADEVFLVNESEYEMVGECSFSAFSDDIESLKCFISDHGLDIKNIEMDTTIQQTL